MTDARLSPEHETAIANRYDLRTSTTAPQVVRRDIFKLLAELDVLREELQRLRAALEAITDEGPCGFDHHGGCQEHMFLDLEGEECPMKVAQDLLGVRDV